jgi:CRISPR/Cas system-associated exonuclease Cas4 (RecB family)
VQPAIRLIQAEDVDAWQRVLLVLCLPPATPARGPAGAIDVPIIVVPSRAAAEQWQRTIEQRLLAEHWSAPRALQQALGHEVVVGAPSALALPRLLTRDQLYDAFHRGARLETPRLSPLVREVLMGASARDAARVKPPPFLLRPGLVAEMLRFHDHIGRLGHQAGQWLDGAAAQLQEEAGTDRGAERLLQQTRFLQQAFRAFEARIDALDGLDDRALRTALRSSARAWCPPHVAIAVADHHADASGLWPVDLTLLAQATGVARIDVVATRGVAETMFVRLRRVWPSATDVRIPRQRPSDTRLEISTSERRWIACRDRDEEVLAYARRVKARQPDDASTSALVYRRPLPYLYAAQFVLGAAGIPYQSSGTLPLAAEPWAAGLDLLMDAALSGFTRASLVTLLRSPHVLVKRPDGTPVGSADVAAFDAWLARQRYLGTLGHLDDLLAQPSSPAPSGASERLTALHAHTATSRYVDEWRQEQAARAVGAAVRPWLARLAPLQSVNAGADHVTALRDAWRACERLPHDDEPQASRTRRTRAAVDLLLDQLAQALASHDTTPVPPRDTCTLVRRWIEDRTFALPRDDEGVQLVDADAAPFGLFDHVRIVGLLEGEWPEPSAREIFYPAFMLERLGWAEERTRTGALRARFADLLSLPAAAVGVSVPELDQDAVVRPSSLLDELQAFDCDRLVPVPADERLLPVTGEDALLATPAYPSAPVVDAHAQDWATWRLARPARAEGGHTAARVGDRYSVTAVETYLQCPFQYFAGRVLGLKEEADDEPGLPARDAGVLLHDVLHDCFQQWRRLGHTTIRPEDLTEARVVFADVAERALQSLPPADRAVERVRLLGSAVATGVLEKMLRVEVELFGDVVRRELEHPIDQHVLLPSGDGPRPVHLRGRIDRVDWTDDGRVRVVDYKTGRRPTQALQPGVYAHAVMQQEKAAGREVGIAPSGFVAFREDVPWVQAVTDIDDADTQATAFVEAVQRIEAGEFPVKPHNPFRCQFCDYASVCRKDYVGDE